MEFIMKKTMFAVLATLAALASTSARADSFYFGFSNNTPHVYVAPRHTYVQPAPRVVYYQPQPEVYYSEWPQVRYIEKHHRHDRGYHRGHGRRDWDNCPRGWRY